MDPTHKKPRSPLNKLFFVISTVLGLGLVFWLLSQFRGQEIPEAFVTKAVVVLSGSNITGTVTFEQSTHNGPVSVNGNLKNLDPNALRGFHVHKNGDVTNGCLSTGPHYNPFGKTHGAPDAKDRHVGDLGNINTNGQGEAVFTFQDTHLSLNGPFSIVGRSIVLHAGTDDLGKGGNDESLNSGNAGMRAACGVIGISS